MVAKIAVAAVVLLASLSTIASALDRNDVYYQRGEEDPAIATERSAWLGALEWCESQGNPKAINPRDSDGTPSYGLLQFKPSTYAEFAKLYGLASTTDYMNPIEQIQIVEHMIIDNRVNLHHQFPACVAHIGMPPKE